MQIPRLSNGYPALKEDVLHTICQNPIPRIPNYCVFPLGHKLKITFQ